jgi:hypothetical protein
MFVEFTSKVNDFTFKMNGMEGWDLKEEKIVACSFDSLGGRGQGVITHGEDLVSVNSREVTFEGKSREHTVIIKRLGPDKITSQTINIKAEGEAKPDSPVLEWTRIMD